MSSVDKLLQNITKPPKTINNVSIIISFVCICFYGLRFKHTNGSAVYICIISVILALYNICVLPVIEYVVFDMDYLVHNYELVRTQLSQKPHMAPETNVWLLRKDTVLMCMSLFSLVMFKLLSRNMIRVARGVGGPIDLERDTKIPKKMGTKRESTRTDNRIDARDAKEDPDDTKEIRDREGKETRETGEGKGLDIIELSPTSPGRLSFIKDTVKYTSLYLLILFISSFIIPQCLLLHSSITLISDPLIKTDHVFWALNILYIGRIGILATKAMTKEKFKISSTYLLFLWVCWVYNFFLLTASNMLTIVFSDGMINCFLYVVDLVKEEVRFDDAGVNLFTAVLVNFLTEHLECEMGCSKDMRVDVLAERFVSIRGYFIECLVIFNVSSMVVLPFVLWVGVVEMRRSVRRSRTDQLQSDRERRIDS